MGRRKGWGGVVTFDLGKGFSVGVQLPDSFAADHAPDVVPIRQPRRSGVESAPMARQKIGGIRFELRSGVYADVLLPLPLDAKERAELASELRRFAKALDNERIPLRALPPSGILDVIADLVCDAPDDDEDDDPDQE